MAPNTATQAIASTRIEKDATEKVAKKPHTVLMVLLTISVLLHRRAFFMYTLDPLNEIRDAEDKVESLLPLVKTFVEEKYSELQTAQVAASFCGGAVFSTLPWCKEAKAHWSVNALWYSAVIWAVSSIITSIQTRSILDDLPDTTKITDNNLHQ